MTEPDKRQQIIEGALRVFSKYGFHKASIKMIAKEAGIKSSALIYHYFEDKKALLEAIIETLTPVGKIAQLDEKLRAQMMDAPPEVVLPQVMATVLALQDSPDVVKMVRLFMSEAAQMPAVADAAADIQKLNLNFLVAYLQVQVDKGRLKPHNVEMSARVLVSTVLINILATNIFTQLADGFGEREAYIQQVVDIFLNGLRSEA